MGSKLFKEKLVAVVEADRKTFASILRTDGTSLRREDFDCESWPAFIRLAVQSGISREEFYSKLHLSDYSLEQWMTNARPPAAPRLGQVVAFVKERVFTLEKAA